MNLSFGFCVCKEILLNEGKFLKIYTKAGDSGQTYLASGKKVPKTDARVELYGSCDELNSYVGWAKTFSEIEDLAFFNFLSDIQNLLFEIGSELAGYTPKDLVGSILTDSDVERLESEIDRLTVSLPELKSFILPGGSQLSGGLHIARTVCRRLEREVLAYTEAGGEIAMEIRVFLNRLSDYFYTAARYANAKQNIKETEWKSRTKI